MLHPVLLAVAALLVCAGQRVPSTVLANAEELQTYLAKEELAAGVDSAE